MREEFSILGVNLPIKVGTACTVRPVQYFFANFAYYDEVQSQAVNIFTNYASLSPYEVRHGVCMAGGEVHRRRCSYGAVDCFLFSSQHSSSLPQPGCKSRVGNYTPKFHPDQNFHLLYAGVTSYPQHSPQKQRCTPLTLDSTLGGWGAPRAVFGPRPGQ